MHLPGPLRAAVGLAATAAAEAKHLPDRAIELPMLVVSSALQASLRAQQRYARYAARGDEVLNRRTPTAEPPPWATFDDPVPPLQFARSGSSGSRSGVEHLFGVVDPTVSPDGREPVDEVLPPDEPPPAAGVPTAPSAVATARPRAAKKAKPGTTSSPKAAAKKAATGAKKKAAAKKASAAGTAAPAGTAAKNATAKAAAKAAATKAAAVATPVEADVDPDVDAASRQPKTVSRPRHTEPSAFDNVADD